MEMIELSKIGSDEKKVYGFLRKMEKLKALMLKVLNNLLLI